MSRQILGIGPQGSQKCQQPLNSRATSKTKSQLSKAEIERVLRKKRSSEYMQTLNNLDAGGPVANQQEVNSLINRLHDELGDLELSGMPQLLGIVSKCYLGEPYEVHVLDLTFNIVEHYPRGEQLPENLEKARGMAMYGNYDYIEVYDTYCCAVSETGDVSILRLA
ncbi:hypothetical protein [Lancefieldella rimae]|uniref:hypothetical protein n=1 Tax=Lancefieldella rimae TaxID=1383 RepID=UPI001CAEEE00|nr:hypothetical protein [Lancefieldella rimae]MBF4803611.1 hypothetical protein [Lancefieldella rimae]